MTRFLIVAEILLSLFCFIFAYWWVFTLDPTDPIIPFGLCVMCGGLFVSAWQRLGEELGE